MNLPHAFTGAGVALALIAILLLHAALDARHGTRMWRTLVGWGAGTLVCAGFLIGLGSGA